MIPATPEALGDIELEGNDVAKIPEPKKEDPPEVLPGLRGSWTKGEQIPWKGIWFEVTAVSFDRILLKPIGTTWKRHKQLKQRTL